MPQLLAGTERGLYRVDLDATGPIEVHKPIAFEKREVDPIAQEAGDSGALYALVDQHELWRSVDQGRFWTKMWEAPRKMRLYTFITHPTKPKVLYAGLEPASVWISDNAGQSWRELEAIQKVPDKDSWTFFSPRFAHVRALAVYHGEPELLSVGIEEGGVYITEDGGQVFRSRNEGLYRDIHAVEYLPRDPNLLLTTTGDGLYRSADRGRSWLHITEGITRSYTVPLWIDPLTPHTMLMAAAAAPPPTWERETRGADALIFRSRDEGLTWQEASKGLPSPQRGMVFCLLGHPEFRSSVYAGTTDGRIYRSEDHGDRWQLVAHNLPAVYSLEWMC